MLLAVDSSVLVVDADSAADQGLAEGPLMHLSAAPSGKFLAGLTAAGRLVVWLSDFSKVRPSLSTRELPALMVWFSETVLVNCSGDTRQVPALDILWILLPPSPSQ